MSIEFENSQILADLAEMRQEMDELKHRIESLQSSMRVVSTMVDVQMEVVQEVFQMEHDVIKDNGIENVAPGVIQARHHTDHIPTLQETLVTFDQLNLHDLFKNEFRASFCCSRKMAYTLKGNDSWVKLVDCAAEVFWSNVKLEENDREWRFYRMVERFNKRIKKSFSTAESMTSALSSEGEWRDKLTALLTEGNEVVTLLWVRS